MRSVFILSFVVLCSSCATILNRRMTDVVVYSKQPIKLQVENDTSIYSVSTRNVPARTVKRGILSLMKPTIAEGELFDDTTRYQYKSEILVKRKMSPLTLRVFYSDSSVFVHRIRPEATPTIWFNYCSFFLGALVDLSNSKGYAYPRVFIDRARRDLFEYAQKGSWGLSLSIPTINNIRHKRYLETGFGLISVALNHHYRDTRFVQARWAFESGMFGEPFGSFVRNKTYSLSLTDNVRFNNLTLGYGLAFVNYDTYDYIDFSDDDRNGGMLGTMQGLHNTTSLGVQLNGYYWFSKVFALGLIYQPTFLNLTTSTRFAYNHLISFDVSFRIPLNKRRR